MQIEEKIKNNSFGICMLTCVDFISYLFACYYFVIKVSFIVPFTIYFFFIITHPQHDQWIPNILRALIIPAKDMANPFGVTLMIHKITTTELQGMASHLRNLKKLQSREKLYPMVISLMAVFVATVMKADIELFGIRFFNYVLLFLLFFLNRSQIKPD
jgi:hypothetical protein